MNMKRRMQLKNDRIALPSKCEASSMTDLSLRCHI